MNAMLEILPKQNEEFDFLALLESFLVRNAISSGHTRRAYETDITEYFTFCQERNLKINTSRSTHQFFIYLTQVSTDFEILF